MLWFFVVVVEYSTLIEGQKLFTLRSKMPALHLTDLIYREVCIFKVLCALRRKFLTVTLKSFERVI